jgi:catechol 2,3-dioxygenase-like lactoylglutathione lyase family enzyme
MKFSLHHIAVQTADFDSAFNFFTRILKLGIIKKPFRFKTRTLCLLNAGNVQIELYSQKGDVETVPWSSIQLDPDHLAFKILDLSAAIERCKKFKVKILKEPFTPPTNDPKQIRVAFIEGPDRQEIELRESG